MAKRTAREITEDKTTQIMNAVATWAAFYRANPHRFCEDYLNVHLKKFQQILIYCMALSTNFCFVAARGQILGPQTEKSA